MQEEEEEERRRRRKKKEEKGEGEERKKGKKEGKGRFEVLKTNPHFQAANPFFQNSFLVPYMRGLVCTVDYDIV